MITNKITCVRGSWLLLIVVALASCSAPPSTMRSRVSGAGSEAGFAQPPQDRPGLGTRWGERRRSLVDATSFQRAAPNRPLATAAIYYNDRAGIEAMAAASQLRRTWPVILGPAASLVSVAVKDQSGRLLPGMIVGDRWFVVGEEGRRYSIVVRNPSDSAAGDCPLGRRVGCARWPAGLGAQARLRDRASRHPGGGWFPAERRCGRGFSLQPGAGIVCAGKVSRFAQRRGDRDRDFQRAGDLSLDRSRGEEAPQGQSVPEPLRHPALGDASPVDATLWEARRTTSRLSDPRPRASQSEASTARAWRPRCICVSLALADAEIFHQDLRLPDE